MTIELFKYFLENSLNPFTSPQEGAQFLIIKATKENPLKFLQANAYLCWAPLPTAQSLRCKEHLHIQVCYLHSRQYLM